jgi:hypothetical protein
MNFTEQKTQITQLMRRGDRKIIAKKAGVSPVTLWSTLSKPNLASMTDLEKKVWSVAVQFINERLTKNTIIEEKTDKLTQRLES